MPGLHMPALHLSPTVQALPSLQSLVLLVPTHRRTGSHAIVTQGLLPAAQGMAIPGRHLPSRHVSFPVQMFLSSQSRSLAHDAWSDPSTMLSEPPIPPPPTLDEASGSVGPPAVNSDPQEVTRVAEKPARGRAAAHSKQPRTDLTIAINVSR